MSLTRNGAPMPAGLILALLKDTRFDDRESPEDQNIARFGDRESPEDQNTLVSTTGNLPKTKTSLVSTTGNHAKTLRGEGRV